MMVTLIVPPGAESAPISHGTVAYVPYREDHTDSHSRWLVDIPHDVAHHFVGAPAGFWPLDPQGSGLLPGVREPNGVRAR